MAHDLLERSFDFIDKALLEFEKRNPDLQLTLIYAAVGMELLLKYPLSTEHWSLVFEKVNEADFEDYRSGDFQSANFNTCRQRLLKICNLDLDNNEWNALNSLRIKRNVLLHFGFITNQEEVAATLADALRVIVYKFLPAIKADDEAELLSEALRDVEHFVEQRMMQISPEIEKHADGNPIVRCPRCKMCAIILSDCSKKKGYRQYCQFCESQFEEGWHIQELNEQEPSDYMVNRYGGCDLTECFSCCCDDVYVLTSVDKISYEPLWYVCFHCGKSSKDGGGFAEKIL